MFGFDNISFSFSYNLFFYVLGIIGIFFLTYFNYKITIPVISNKLKYLLFFIRFIALSLLLFLIFEPILSLSNKTEIELKNLVFIDNSSSISAKDSLLNKNKINELITNLKDNLTGETEFYQFGRNVSKLNADSLVFNEPLTNYYKIIEQIKKSADNVNSVILVSDGIINDGINPVNSIEKLGIPFFTVPIGDTSTFRDVSIQKITHNDFIYSNTTSNIEVYVANNQLSNSNTKISFFENNKLIQTKDLTLSNTGIDKLEFEYTPKTAGEKKLTFSVSEIGNDKNPHNNKFIEFINVLDSKIKIALLSSSPSSDVSFVYNSLKQNENYNVKLFQQVGTQTLNGQNIYKELDSAKIVILAGFPSAFTNSDLISKVKAIIEKGTPFFFINSVGTDLTKLKAFDQYLPFTIRKEIKRNILVQPFIVTPIHSILSTQGENAINQWNDLPPVYKTESEIIAKSEAEIIAKTKIQNIPTESPLILTRAIGKYRALVILNNELWKWKLANSNKNSTLFDSFINSSIQWLNVHENQKQLNVKTSKKIYAIGEPIDFLGSAYDESFNPVENAEIKVVLKMQKDSKEFLMESIGNGQYQSLLSELSSGNYSFTAVGKIANKTIGQAKGIFSIGELNLEKMVTKQNLDLLQSYAGLSGGKLINLDEQNRLIKTVNDLTNKSKKIKTDNFEIKLWSKEIALIILILLFAVEWFLRKKAGLQ